MVGVCIILADSSHKKTIFIPTQIRSILAYAFYRVNFITIHVLNVYKVIVSKLFRLVIYINFRPSTTSKCLVC